MKKFDSENKSTLSIGIIMLNTDFPRPLGDVGNPQSYQYEVQIFKLTHANVDNVVFQGLSEDVIQEVIAAGHQLKASGVSLLTTSCGFLAPLQAQVQQAVGLPFIASSLCLLPFIRQCFGVHSPIGIITFDSRQLQATHFNGHYDDQLFIAGIEAGQELHTVIKSGKPHLNEQLAQTDVINAALTLMDKKPQCLLLECTNLSPYKGALREHFALPVFDLVDAVHWLANAH